MLLSRILALLGYIEGSIGLRWAYFRIRLFGGVFRGRLLTK